MSVPVWRLPAAAVGAILWLLPAVLFATAPVRAADLKPGEMKAGATFKECHGCPEMVVVGPGTFTMGSPDTEKERTNTEGPQHEVTIAHAFAISKYPVTREEYQNFVRATRRPYNKPCDYWEKPIADSWLSDIRHDWKKPGFAQSGKDPVVCVSWDDAQDFIEWLNTHHIHSHSPRVGPYRLLTEAEWEFAVRGGTTTPYWQGEELAKNVADCQNCGSKWDNNTTAPSGVFPANPLGLYDTEGNVWQWLDDCWHDSYKNAPTDGSAWVKGNCAVRVVRGGSFITPQRQLRSAMRYRWPQANPNYSIGFRLARTLDEPPH